MNLKDQHCDVTKTAGRKAGKHGRFRRGLYLAMVWTAIFTPYILVTVSGAEDKKLTLKESIQTAFERNYEIRAVRNSVLAQKQDIDIARSFLLPQISVEERFTRTNNPPGVFMSKLNQERFGQADFAIDSLNHPRPVNDMQTTASLEQTVFSGKALVGLSMAKKDFAAKQQDFARKKEETALHVTRAYLEVATAKEYLSAVKSGLNDAAEHLRIAEALERNGIGLYADVLRAKTAVTAAEQRMVTAEKNLTLAKRALGLLLGADEGFDVVDQRVDFSPADIQSFPQLTAMRKDIRAMELRYENAGNNVRMAQSRYLPNLGIRAAYQLNDHNNMFGTEGESWWLMGVLRWDLFDGAGREYECRKAHYKQNEAREQLAGLKSMVSFKITEASLAVEEAGKIRDLARSALATAEEGKKLVESRYTNSLSPLVDLLDVQTSVDGARAGVVAKENEYQLAVIRLHYEAGTILQTLGVE